jgi:putative SOS response-associated peptidase YedK
MCGRYLIIMTPEAMRRLFGYPELPNFPARYNVAPTQPIPIVRMVEGKRQFALVRWGLIPAWVKDPKGFSLLINARGESVNDKPAFRNAMKRRRCLIPADGFYEWTKSPADLQASILLMRFKLNEHDLGGAEEVLRKAVASAPQSAPAGIGDSRLERR